VTDDALRTRLRAADPAESLAPADPDEVSRMLHVAMSRDTGTETRSSGTRGRSRLTWAVAGAAVVLIGLVAAYGLVGGASSPMTPPADRPPADDLELALPDGAAGRCTVPTPEALGRADVAFDGEVEAVSDGRVRLRPSQFYEGGPADRVEVARAGPARERLLLGVRFQEGERYLVAANGGQVMVCGFSGAYDPRLAELYAEAFAR